MELLSLTYLNTCLQIKAIDLHKNTGKMCPFNHLFNKNINTCNCVQLKKLVLPPSRHFIELPTTLWYHNIFDHFSIQNSLSSKIFVGSSAWTAHFPILPHTISLGIKSGLWLRQSVTLFLLFECFLGGIASVLWIIVKLKDSFLL